MQQSILFKVPGKPSTSPIVILNGPAIRAQYSTPASVRLSHALSRLNDWRKCDRTPRRIVLGVAVASVAVTVFSAFSVAVTGAQSSRVALAVSAVIGLTASLLAALSTPGASAALKEGGERCTD